MPERKVKAALPSGQLVDAMEVDVSESNEKWSEVTLDDGTVLRIKSTVVSAVRFPGQFDAEGNPLYMIKTTATTSLISVPERLRKKVQ